MVDVGEILATDFVNREVTDEDAGVSRGLSSNTLWKVAKSKVDGIGSLPSRELGKLCFIRGDDDRCSGRVLWKSPLDTVRQSEQGKG